MTWAPALSLLGLVALLALYAACRVARWHRENFRRIARHKLDWTAGQYASRDWK